MNALLPKDWKWSHLGAVIDLVSGQHIDSQNCNVDGRGVPYITGPSDFNDGVIVTNRYTESPRVSCKSGDVLLTVKGSGTGSLVVADKAYCISRQLMAVRPTGANSDFVRVILDAHTDTYNRISAGLIPGISRGDVLNTRIALPPHPEQREIALTILAWRDAIEKIERLLALHSHRKAWLLSKIILAIGSDVKLSKFLIPVSRAVPKPLEPYWALGIRSHGKGTFQRYIADPSTVDMEEVYQVKRNDLIVNITFAWEGAIAFVQPGDEHCVVSHRFPTYEIAGNVADYGFVKYAVNHKSFFTKLALISPGGAGRNRVLNKKDFLKLSIRLPSLDDQRKYAAVLDTAEREIALLRKQLSAFKLQKRGLMQKLLTGQWRIKPTSAETA